MLIKAFKCSQLNEHFFLWVDDVLGSLNVGWVGGEGGVLVRIVNITPLKIQGGRGGGKCTFGNLQLVGRVK